MISGFIHRDIAGETPFEIENSKLEIDFLPRFKANFRKPDDIRYNYMLNTQITELETISKLEHRLSQKSVTQLKPRVKAILDRVLRRPVPEKDKVE